MVGGKLQAFPWDSWEQEFYSAREVGLDMIDWLVTADNFYENPLLTAEGVKRIKVLMSETGMGIDSACAHYFVEYSLLRCSNSELKERLDILELLLTRLNQVGIKYLEIPLFEKSDIKDETDLKQMVQIIKPILHKAHKLGITVAFETSLRAEMVRTFLSALEHPAARATYDMGNSAELGYNPEEELETYGELIATVHIKDKVLNGETVSLGQGDTNFPTCFSILKTLNYTGPYILEVARVGGELESARKNLAFVKSFLKD